MSREPRAFTQLLHLVLDHWEKHHLDPANVPLGIPVHTLLRTVEQRNHLTAEEVRRIYDSMRRAGHFTEHVDDEGSLRVSPTIYDTFTDEQLPLF